MQNRLQEINKIDPISLIKSDDHADIDQSDNDFLFTAFQDSTHFLLLFFAVFEKFSQYVAF